MRSAAEIARWDDAADVVIAGLGCAGACAGLEARAAGADVLVLEREALGGGTSALSGGLIYLGGGTPVQKQCGFEDSPEAMQAYLLAACGPGPDAAKIGLFCERSVEHFHWLVAQGVPFKASFYPEGGTEPPTDDGLIFSGSEAAHPFVGARAPGAARPPPPEGRRGRRLPDAEAARRADGERGARRDGRARRSARARDGGSRRRRRGAHAGWRARAARPARRGARDRRLHPRRRDARPSRALAAALQGPDRLRRRRRLGNPPGLAAGAEAIRLDAASISLPYYPPKQLKQGLLVNRAGQRFINEDAYYGRAGEFALLRQDGQAWLIVDDAIYARPMGGMKLAAVGETIEELEARARLHAGHPRGDGRALQPLRRQPTRSRVQQGAGVRERRSRSRPSARSTAASSTRSTRPSRSAVCARGRAARC